MWWRKEGNVLFNIAHNTFYLWLYVVGHMVKNHSDSERKNPLLPLHGLLFSIRSKGSIICSIPQTASTVCFVMSVVEHWEEQEIAQMVYHEWSIRGPITLWSDALPWSYILLLNSLGIVTICRMYWTWFQLWGDNRMKLFSVPRMTCVKKIVYYVDLSGVLLSKSSLLTYCICQNQFSY